jgi:hypothetical protein
MKVLVIPEDPRIDQYMLKPLVEAALAYAGNPKAIVAVCQDGELRGDSTVLKFDKIKEIMQENLLYDAFFLCVDRDCRAERAAQLSHLKQDIDAAFPNKTFVAVCGVEELEVWVLAGMEKFAHPWNEVRSECHPKETYFEPYAAERGVTDSPGRGRQALGKEAASRYSERVRNLCEEIRVCEQQPL